MFFPKLLNHFTKNINYIRNKHIYYQLIKNKIIPYKIQLPYIEKKKTEIYFNDNSKNYIKIIVISTVTGLFSYSSLYVYTVINHIVLLFSS